MRILVVEIYDGTDNVCQRGIISAGLKNICCLRDRAGWYRQEVKGRMEERTMCGRKQKRKSNEKLTSIISLPFYQQRLFTSNRFLSATKQMLRSSNNTPFL